MALKQQERDIDGVKYRCYQLPFTPSRQLMRRLFNLAGPTFGAAIKGNRTLKSILDTEVNLGAALSSLAERLSDEDVDYVHGLLAKQCEVSLDGGWQKVEAVAETHFAERGMKHWFSWLRFCLEVNYGDFFGGAESAARELTERMRVGKSESSTPEA